MNTASKHIGHTKVFFLRTDMTRHRKKYRQNFLRQKKSQEFLKNLENLHTC